jgi:hypothetical protein
MVGKNGRGDKGTFLKERLYIEKCFALDAVGFDLLIIEIDFVNVEFVLLSVEVS